MRLSTTSPTRASSTALCGLAMVQLIAALSAHSPTYAVVLLLVGCSLASVSGLALHRCDGLGARLAAGSAAAVTAVSVVLVATAGLPGRESSGLSATDAATLVLALSVLLLLALDARSCPASESAVPPYAL